MSTTMTQEINMNPEPVTQADIDRVVDVDVDVWVEDKHAVLDEQESEI